MKAHQSGSDPVLSVRRGPGAIGARSSLLCISRRPAILCHALFLFQCGCHLIEKPLLQISMLRELRRVLPEVPENPLRVRRSDILDSLIDPGMLVQKALRHVPHQTSAEFRARPNPMGGQHLWAGGFDHDEHIPSLFRIQNIHIFCHFEIVRKGFQHLLDLSPTPLRLNLHISLLWCLFVLSAQFGAVHILPMRFFDRKNNFGLQTDDFTVNLTSTMCCVRFVRIQMHCRCVFWRNADDNITENECPAFGFYLYPDDLLVPYI